MGLRIGLDPANGSASWFGPDLLRELGAEVVAIHADPDGTNINVGAAQRTRRLWPTSFEPTGWTWALRSTAMRIGSLRSASMATSSTGTD